MVWLCYILRCTDDNHKNLTYNGSTNNIIRRIKQHNSKLKGGAKSTHGKNWQIYAILTGFDTHVETLSCEWRIKHPTGSKKRPPKYCGVNGRILGLNEIFMSEKWTSKCEKNISDGKYNLYLTKDIIDNLNKEMLPSNIEIHEIEEFTDDFLNAFV